MGRWTFFSLSPRQHCEKGVSGSGGKGAKYYKNCGDHDLSKILIIFCATKWESRILNSKSRLFHPLLDLLLKAGVLTTSEQSIWFWSMCQNWVNKCQEPSGIPLLSDLHAHKPILFLHNLIYYCSKEQSAPSSGQNESPHVASPSSFPTVLAWTSLIQSIVFSIFFWLILFNLYRRPILFSHSNVKSSPYIANPPFTKVRVHALLPSTVKLITKECTSSNYTPLPSSLHTFATCFWPDHPI